MNETNTEQSNDSGQFRYCMDYKNSNWRKEYFIAPGEYIYLEIFNGTTDTKYHIPLDSYDCDETQLSAGPSPQQLDPLRLPIINDNATLIQNQTNIEEWSWYHEFKETQWYISINIHETFTWFVNTTSEPYTLLNRTDYQEWSFLFQKQNSTKVNTFRNYTEIPPD